MAKENWTAETVGGQVFGGCGMNGTKGSSVKSRGTRGLQRAGERRLVTSGLLQLVVFCGGVPPGSVMFWRSAYVGQEGSVCGMGGGGALGVEYRFPLFVVCGGLVLRGCPDSLGWCVRISLPLH